MTVVLPRAGDPFRHGRPAHSDPATVLTPRQWEVLYGASRGEQARDTGQRLGIKPETVKYHRTAILQRLDARAMHHAVAIAIERGILP